MFFILNKENIVIAASEDFLKYSNSKSIFTLAEEFRKGNMKLHENDHTFSLEEGETKFSKEDIETLFGSACIYKSIEQEALADNENVDASIPAETLHHEEQNTEREKAGAKEELLEILENDSSDNIPLDVEKAEPNTDDELIDLLDTDKPLQDQTNDQETKKADDEILDLLGVDKDEDHNNDIDSLASKAAVAASGLNIGSEDISTFLKEDKDISKALPAEEEPAEQSPSDTFDLIDLDNDTRPDTAVEKMDIIHDKTHNESTQTQENEPTNLIDIKEDTASAPFANYSENANIIGISTDEYVEFLGQFTDEAVESEIGLRGNDFYVFKNHLSSIRDAAQLLHLPRLSQELDLIDNSTSEERDALLDTFYGHIQHIRHDIKAGISAVPQAHEEPVAEQTSPNIRPENNVELSATADVPQAHQGIDFEDIKPIPFDFSPKTAADELGLPESLVSEFVADFVDQAKENLEVLDQAHQKGDIETVQKTSHLLKGAASNLRIDPIASTLETLQHNEDAAKIPDLLQQFVGQLKMLENYIGKQNII